MEDFVTYELAIKLKEKGFNEACFGHYVNNQLFIAHPINEFHSDDDISVDAPTISQVLKWLRKEKKMYIELFLYNGTYSYLIKDIIKKCEDDLFHECMNDDTTDDEFNSYEEAVFAGIEYAVDNLI